MLKFSVVMAVYSGDRYCQFKKAMESISVEQSVRPNEIILVVDGPIGEEINDYISVMEQNLKYLKVIRLKNNKGLGNALKVGIEASSYEWIARMDSDDISHPDRFEKQVNYLCKNKNVDVLGTFIVEQSNTNELIKTVPLTNESIQNKMKWKNSMNHVTIFARKKCIVKAGNYRTVLYAEDYDLWVRMMAKGACFQNIPECLVTVKTGDSMLHRRSEKELIGSWDLITNELYKNKDISFYLYLARKIYIRIWTYLPIRLKKVLYSSLLRKNRGL